MLPNILDPCFGALLRQVLHVRQQLALLNDEPHRRPKAVCTEHIHAARNTRALGSFHVKSQQASIPSLSDGLCFSLPPPGVLCLLRVPDTALPGYLAVSWPFTVAMAGKRFKADLTKHTFFSKKLGVDCADGQRPVHVQDYVSLTGSFVFSIRLSLQVSFLTEKVRCICVRHARLIHCC